MGILLPLFVDEYEMIIAGSTKTDSNGSNVKTLV
jgi:hypothetical protein